MGRKPKVDAYTKLNLVEKYIEGTLTFKECLKISEAIISIKYKELILHLDQGAVYTCPNFQNFVKQNGITMSMSRRGNCNDNAVMESFFS